MKPLPPMSAIRVFEAAARHEHFSAAAAELGMTQAAVSYQIKMLEDRLGVTLFDRHGRRVTLTDRGRLLAPGIIRAFDDLRATFTAFSTRESDILSVSCALSAASLWLLPRLHEFHARHPDIVVRLDATDRRVDFARDDVDIGVRGGPGGWDRVEATLLGRQRIAPCCSPEFLARHGPFTHARQLLDLPLLTADDAWWYQWFSAMRVPYDPKGLAHRIDLGLQQLEGRTAIAGHGLAILNPRLWEADFAAGLLVEAMPSNVVSDWSYWAVHPPQTRNVRKVRLFREWLVECFASVAIEDHDA